MLYELLLPISSILFLPFNFNFSAPGLLAVGGYPLPKLDAEHLRLQEDLLRRMPVGLMLACLNQLERESDKKASINQCPVSQNRQTSFVITVQFLLWLYVESQHSGLRDSFKWIQFWATLFFTPFHRLCYSPLEHQPGKREAPNEAKTGAKFLTPLRQVIVWLPRRFF